MLLLWSTLTNVRWSYVFVVPRRLCRKPRRRCRRATYASLVRMVVCAHVSAIAGPGPCLLSSSGRGCYYHWVCTDCRVAFQRKIFVRSESCRTLLDSAFGYFIYVFYLAILYIWQVLSIAGNLPRNAVRAEPFLIHVLKWTRLVVDQRSMLQIKAEGVACCRPYRHSNKRSIHLRQSKTITHETQRWWWKPSVFTKTWHHKIY